MSEQIYSSAVIYLRVSTKEQAQKGGEAEGYSIPAQRAACLRKAEALGIKVVDEFVDAGESAKTSARPQLQAMLSRLEEGDIQYVIVHKIDRLARNRVDDVTINVAIKQAGAKLVSVSENIDETPSGHLMHGIMSSIAEFYSKNLSTEVMKGMNQKVHGGGTPGRAPLGYLNVGKVTDGREVRTVEIDPVRGPLVAWAFKEYATGTWSTRQLAAELGKRGLTQRFSKSKPYEPVRKSVVHAMLSKRYYLGYVNYMGVEYQGKHQPLVDETTFTKVQEVLQAHKTSGARSYRTTQYLSGTLFCGRCHSRLAFAISKGRVSYHGYFFCMGRHEKRTACDLPYLKVHEVEDTIVDLYASEPISTSEKEALVAEIREEIPTLDIKSSLATKRLKEEIEEINQQRYIWAEKAVEGLVPNDIVREKQAELATKLAYANSQLAKLSVSAEKREKLLLKAIRKAENCHFHYKDAVPALRRKWNQAWWDMVELDADEDRSPTVRKALRSVMPEGIHYIRGKTTDVPIRSKVAEILKNRQIDAGDLYNIPERGSRVEFLAGETGLEPATPGFGDQCSTN